MQHATSLWLFACFWRFALFFSIRIISLTKKIHWICLWFWAPQAECPRLPLYWRICEAELFKELCCVCFTQLLLKKYNLFQFPLRGCSKYGRCFRSCTDFYRIQTFWCVGDLNWNLTGARTSGIHLSIFMSTSCWSTLRNIYAFHTELLCGYASALYILTSLLLEMSNSLTLLIIMEIYCRREGHSHSQTTNTDIKKESKPRVISHTVGRDAGWGRGTG